MCLAITRGVYSTDNISFLSPNDAVTIGLAGFVFLIVHGTEEVVAKQAHEHEDSEGILVKLVWVRGEVLRLESVGEWQPD